MTPPTQRLIALEGVNAHHMMDEAKMLLAAKRQQRAGLSAWDASGIFREVMLADVGAGAPSARTLLLLYAADLAFRIHWEVMPALGAGRVMIVAPYVDTAIAFGRAAGLEEEWLADMFSFAPVAATRRYVDAPPSHAISDRKGFVEFGCQQVLGAHAGVERVTLIRRTSGHLKARMKRRAS